MRRQCEARNAGIEQLVEQLRTGIESDVVDGAADDDEDDGPADDEEQVASAPAAPPGAYPASDAALLQEFRHELSSLPNVFDK